MILICDDDRTIRATLTLVLKRAGYETAAVSSPAEALSLIRQTVPDLILMDMNYTQKTSGEEGLELLARVKVLCPEIPVILITAWGSISLAVQGMRAGAYDFITKPWNNLMLLSVIETALRLRENAEDSDSGDADGVGGMIRPAKIIGQSPLLDHIFVTISRIASTNAPVLITGESGTGKELIAEAIHEYSNRKKKPFVKVNLGGISQSLFESEMFGHKKGAFTDAHYDRTGRFELADKGTIFLDEIGELDMVSQVKLLRVLQDQTFESLGESTTKQVDARVVSATNRNLTEMVAQGDFREDLFYRINLITIHVPALRDRPEDIPLLAEHFISRLVECDELRPVEITSDGMDFLKKLPYPGNIRELKNLVERTILVSGKSQIEAADFEKQSVEIPALQDVFGVPIQPLEQTERQMILRAMEVYGRNISKVASALGFSRQALYRRMEKYGIEKG